jgi:hypothetical protein
LHDLNLGEQLGVTNIDLPDDRRWKMYPPDALVFPKASIAPDIYAAAFTALCMSQGQDPIELLTASPHRRPGYVDIESPKLNLSDDLRAFFRRAMSSDPSERFQNPVEALAVLGGLWSETKLPPIEQRAISPRDVSLYEKVMAMRQLFVAEQRMADEIKRSRDSLRPYRSNRESGVINAVLEDLWIKTKGMFREWRSKRYISYLESSSKEAFERGYEELGKRRLKDAAIETYDIFENATARGNLKTILRLGAQYDSLLKVGTTLSTRPQYVLKNIAEVKGLVALRKSVAAMFEEESLAAFITERGEQAIDRLNLEERYQQLRRVSSVPILNPKSLLDREEKERAREYFLGLKSFSTITKNSLTEKSPLFRSGSYYRLCQHALLLEAYSHQASTANLEPDEMIKLYDNCIWACQQMRIYYYHERKASHFAAIRKIEYEYESLKEKVKGRAQIEESSQLKELKGYVQYAEWIERA